MIEIIGSIRLNPIKVFRTQSPIVGKMVLVSNFDSLIANSTERLFNLNTKDVSPNSSDYPNLPPVKEFLINWHTPIGEQSGFKEISGFEYDEGKIFITEGSNLWQLDRDGAVIDPEKKTIKVWKNIEVKTKLLPPIQYGDFIFVLETDGELHQINKLNGHRESRKWGGEKGIASHVPILGKDSLYYIRGNILYAVNLDYLQEAWTSELKTNVQFEIYSGYFQTWMSSLSPLPVLLLKTLLLIPFAADTTGVNGANIFSYLSSHLGKQETNSFAWLASFFTANFISGKLDLPKTTIENHSLRGANQCALLTINGWEAGNDLAIFFGIENKWTVRPGIPDAPVEQPVLGLILLKDDEQIEISYVPFEELQGASSVFISQVSETKNGATFWLAFSSSLLFVELTLEESGDLTKVIHKNFLCDGLQMTCPPVLGVNEIAYVGGKDNKNGDYWIAAFNLRSTEFVS
ncbi:hypothetical protein NDA03_23750 [Trichocoleus sp. Lan]|uniref:hypothetical protein n=1 Tax=Trichocoleus sp. Lan TaxID=2933927 RepID=UPI0032991132